MSLESELGKCEDVTLPMDPTFFPNDQNSFSIMAEKLPPLDGFLLVGSLPVNLVDDVGCDDGCFNHAEPPKKVI